MTLIAASFPLTGLLPANVLHAQALNCDALLFSAAEAVPFTQLEITGIPGDAGPDLILQIMIDDEEAGRVLAAQAADGRYVMYGPVNPEFSLDPISVHLRFLDDEEEAGLHSCGDFPFDILALPPAPGYFEDYLEQLHATMRTLGEYTLQLSPTLTEIPLDEVPFYELPAVWGSRLMFGNGNWPGLEAILSGEYYADRVTAEEWEFIEAIFAARPALSGAEFESVGLPEDGIFYWNGSESGSDSDSETETGSRILRDTGSLLYASAGNTAGFRTSLPAFEFQQFRPGLRPMVKDCFKDFDASYYNPSAEQLQSYFSMQNSVRQQAGNVRQAGNHVADLQVGLFAVGALGGPKGFMASRLGAIAAANMAATSIAAANLMTQLSQAILPSELGSFTLEHEGPYDFNEDDEIMDVEWTNAEVTAYSQEFDVTQATSELLWAAGGGKVLQRAYRNVQDRFMWTAAFEEEAAGVGIGTLMNELNLQTKSIPSCLFGPVDITEEPWTISYTGISGREHLLEKIDHQNFEVRETGEASPYVCVAAELMNPGASGCQGGVPRQFIPVNTKAIEVRITTLSGAIARSRQEKPGTTLVYIAEVRNANNEQVSWSVSNSEHTLWQGGTDNHEATIELSTDSDDFPFTLTVESTSTTGLRAMPDSPPRRHSITISELEEDERFSCLNEFEIAMTELDRCGFVAYVEGTLPGSGRMPPVPISECMTGEIYRWMVNTHGIHHLEMRGRFEHGNAQITLRVDYDGLAKLETSDFAVYGYLMKGIMQPTRTPRGQPGPDRRQPRLSEALELRSGDLTIYPLAGMPYYGSQFKFELKPYTGTRRLRGTGYTVEGMLMGGESCP